MCKVLATGQSVGCKAKTGATMSGFDNSGVRVNFTRTSINPRDESTTVHVWLVPPCLVRNSLLLLEEEIYGILIANL